MESLADNRLDDSAERLRAIFSIAPAGIYELAPDGRFLRANPRFSLLTGYTEVDLRGLHMQDIVHPEDRATELIQTQRLISGEIDAYSIENRLLCKDGSVVWAEVNRAVIRNLDGSVQTLIGVARDLTAQRDAEARVAALNLELEDRVALRTAELAQANANLEAFTYSVSHDLRAPLRALNGFAEALAEEYGEGFDELGRDYLRRIESASQRMSGLIDDMLQLTRVSRVEMNLRPVDLSTEVTTITDELRRQNPDREVRLDIQPGITVTADYGLIRAALQNLVENAWKFTGKTEGAHIEFGTATRDDGTACYFVRDNGAGFDPVYTEKLFQPFQRLHSMADFPGTGVGLASVKRIIERHGGQAWAEGKPDQGATFSFTLGTPSDGPAC